jgi:hypothetical protein
MSPSLSASTINRLDATGETRPSKFEVTAYDHTRVVGR